MKDDSASELMKRYRRLIDSLQPQARFWAEKQAKIERGRPVLDVRALEAAVSQRFGPLPSSGPPQSGAGFFAGSDPAEMAVIVILMMVQDGDEDLQVQMQEAEEQMQAKQALRALINEMQQLQTQLASERGTNCSTSCQPVCACELDQDLEAGLVGPVSTLTDVNCACIPDIQPEPKQGTKTVGISAQQLASLVAQLQDKLDSDNEISEETTMRLQMLMDERSKLLQLASDIEKSKSETTRP